jgi:hypothetical protein
MPVNSSNHEWVFVTHPEPDWDIISYEEAAGYNSDRIILFLGPEALVYSLLLTSILPTSSLLTQLTHLPHRNRHLRIPFLSTGILHCYYQL